MQQIELGGQCIGIEHLGPDLDPATIEFRARQLGHFMNDVYATVYEDELGLKAIGERPFYFENVTELTSLIQRSNLPRDNRLYIEMVTAMELNNSGEPSEKIAAIIGLAIALKLHGPCTNTIHKPTTIYEIDVARAMYGSKLAYHLLHALVHLHVDDPRVEAKVYQGNERSIRFHQKLGFAQDKSIPPSKSEMYEGEWIELAVSGRTFKGRLAELLE